MVYIRKDKMKTNKQLRQLAGEIISDAREWPAEARDEVLEELISLTAREEELSSDETDLVRDMVSARI
jgi:hypothetical protein